MKPILIFGLLLLGLGSCRLGKKKVEKSMVTQQQVAQQQVEDTHFRRLLKDSLNWQQEKWRTITILADSLHPTILIQEHTQSKAQQGRIEEAQKQSLHLYQAQIHQQQTELETLPPRSWKWLGYFGFIAVFIAAVLWGYYFYSKK